MMPFTSSSKYPKKASDFFLKLCGELDLEKYKSDKYRELIKLSSLQHMHDADLAYHDVYHKCSENACSKTNLLNCLELEEKLLSQHPGAFDNAIYRNHVHNAIKEIKDQLNSGTLNYLFI
jgi:hypothetical protein